MGAELRDISQLLPPTSAEELMVARKYIKAVKARLMDKYVTFSQEVREAVGQIIDKAQDGRGSPVTRLRPVPVAAMERIKASLKGNEDLILVLDSFLSHNYRVSDKVLGKRPMVLEKVSDESVREGKLETEVLALLVDMEGVDEEFVTKWFRFLLKVGDELSTSGRHKDELLRQVCNFNIGMINGLELCVVVVDMIGEHRDLVHEFLSILRPGSRHDQEDVSQSNSSENATKRKRRDVGEAHPPGPPSQVCKRCKAAARKPRRGCEVSCREITLDEEEEMNHVDVLELQIGQACEFAVRRLIGCSSTNSFGKAYFQRFVNEIYGSHGKSILAMVEGDPLNTLPTVLSRLKEKQRELQEYRAHIRKCVTNYACGK